MKIKATNLELTLHISRRLFQIKSVVEGFDGELVANWVPNFTNNTSISINNGERLDRGKVSIKAGDVLSLHLPFGGWTGRVYEILKRYQHRDFHFILEGEVFMRIGYVTWEGNFTGLDYGISGFGNWKVNGFRGMVETPEYSDPIPWDIFYYAIRLRDYLYYSKPEERDELFRRIVTFMMDLKAEIEVKKMLEKL